MLSYSTDLLNLGKVQTINICDYKDMDRINIGCGQTPTSGWKNFDNSYSIRLARFPVLSFLLLKSGLILQEQYDYQQFVRNTNINFGDVIKGLPLSSGSADVIYSSHVFEHLDRREAGVYLQEAWRILCPGGILRLVVPDLAMIIAKYNSNRDGDAFVTELYLSQSKPGTLTQRIRAAVVGSRIHQWAYDADSLSKFLLDHGFTGPKVLKPGETTIPDPGPLNLSERADVSLYIEAKKPSSHNV